LLLTLKYGLYLLLDRFLNKGQDEFKKALQGAKDILGKEDVSEIDAYTSYVSLYKSMMQLVLKADKSELCKAITNTEEINLSLYTENSKTKLYGFLSSSIDSNMPLRGGAAYGARFESRF